MKKLLSLIIFIGISITTYCQKGDSLPIPDTAKLTLGKVYSDVKSGIQGLAQSLKVPATHVYNIMIKQQLVKSISSLVIITTFAVMVFLFIKMGKNYQARYDKSNVDSDETMMIIGYIGFVVSALLFIKFFWADYDVIIGGFVNPEYGAIKEIISFVK